MNSVKANDWIIIDKYITISKDGKIFTKDRYIYRNNQRILLKGKEKRQTDNNTGYLQIRIDIDKKRYTFYVHQAVARKYIDNPNNLKEVNHKDGNKYNNHYTNLEWCTRKENMNHSQILHNRLRKKSICPICGNSFELRETSQIYCSNKCSHENRKKDIQNIPIKEILNVLKSFDFNKTKTAEYYNIHRTTLNRILNKNS